MLYSNSGTYKLCNLHPAQAERGLQLAGISPKSGHIKIRKLIYLKVFAHKPAGKCMR